MFDPRSRLLLAVLLATLATVSAATGQSKSAADRPGELLYRVHCASCHGLEAHGKGPVAQHLREAPPDLTVLAREAGGTFPRNEVYRAIDGRDEIPTHGSREMPVWGISLKTPGYDANQEDDVARSIWDLVDYIQSLQTP